MLDARVRFYGDLDDESAASWLAHTRPHPAVAQLTPLTYTAYLHHPVSYLLCTRDEALPIEAQKGMVASLPGIDVHSVDAGHSPYLSKEAEVVAVIEKVAITA